MPIRLDTRSPSFEAEFSLFLAAKRAAVEGVEASVAAIVADVRARGDAAVIESSERYDNLTLEPADFRVGEAEIEDAVARAPPELMAAIRQAADRIAAYHQRQLPPDASHTDEAGVTLGTRWTPIRSVGAYVPGGKAAYLSTVLMTAIPARAAGVPRLVMVVPSPGGHLNPLVLAAARVSGVDEIYRIGGAQAVAALAFGTKTFPAVDKIVGPGNVFVAAAKRQVFGTVGIDLEAGPSEILIVADGDNDPEWIAADLLAQAEHDETAQAVLIADDEWFAAAVVAAVETSLGRLERKGIAGPSWRDNGAVIIVSDLDQAVDLIDRMAPEHLELAVAEPERLAAKVHNAGAIFLGRFTPEAIGDYVAGPSHVLPTGRSARYASGLSVFDFLKRSSILHCDENALGVIGPAAVVLAEAEGLGAHAHSVRLRLGAAGGG